MSETQPFHMPRPSSRSRRPLRTLADALKHFGAEVARPEPFVPGQLHRTLDLDVEVPAMGLLFVTPHGLLHVITDGHTETGEESTRLRDALTTGTPFTGDEPVACFTLAPSAWRQVDYL